ncbi:hypothetical protein [Brevundimonas sp.]|uniref:hypothetical protein n=1 Tax=Brevundimonas sp. TaxID=1871086 RepID=UPI0035AE3872
MGAVHDERDRDFDFTAKRMAWVEATLLHPDVKHFAARVGVLVAAHLSRKHGYAYPSIADMARQLGATETGVSGAIKQLVAAGRLRVVAPTGAWGRTHHNRYYLIGSDGSQPLAAWYRVHKAKEPPMAVAGLGDLAAKPPMAVAETPNGHCQNPQQPLSHNPLSKPIEESQRQKSGATWLSEGSVIPDGFPDALAMKEARLIVASENSDADIGEERHRFFTHAMLKDRRCLDWRAAWRRWIEAAIDGLEPDLVA